MRLLVSVFVAPVLVVVFLLWLNAEMGFPVR